MKKIIYSTMAFLLVVGLGLAGSVAGASGFGDVDIHGFISQGYLYSDEYNYLAHNSTDGTFEYNEVGINFGKSLTDRLRVGVQFFSRDLGDISNNKITVDWAYGDYLWKDWLGIRAGKIKLPFGLYGEIRDVDILRTSIVMPQGIYREYFRETTAAANGVGLYGNISLGPMGSVDYQLIAGVLGSDSDGGQGKYTNDKVMGFATSNADNECETSYSGSIRWATPLDGLLLGYSNLTGWANFQLLINDYIPDIGGTTTVSEFYFSNNIISAEYVWNNLTLSIEYSYADTEIETLGEKIEKTEISYYAAASYRFNDFFTFGAYYSEYYPDKDDKDGEHLEAEGTAAHRAWQNDLAATLRFDLNEYWVFKVEGHMVDGTSSVLAIDNADSDWTEDKWYYGAAKMTFFF